jgi:hypothetical protein
VARRREPAMPRRVCLALCRHLAAGPSQRFRDDEDRLTLRFRHAALIPRAGPDNKTSIAKVRGPRRLDGWVSTLSAGWHANVMHSSRCLIPAFYGCSLADPTGHRWETRTPGTASRRRPGVPLQKTVVRHPSVGGREHGRFVLWTPATGRMSHRPGLPMSGHGPSGTQQDGRRPLWVEDPPTGKWPEIPPSKPHLTRTMRNCYVAGAGSRAPSSRGPPPSTRR